MSALQPAPEPERSSSEDRSYIKSSGGEKVSDWSIVKDGSIFFLALSAFFAFGFDLNTFPKLMVFIATLSISLGGFASMLSGKATLTVGKWFKATGVLAAFLFIILVIMKAAGVLPRSIRSVGNSITIVSVQPKAAVQVALISPQSK